MIKDVQYQMEAVKELVKKTRDLLAESGTRKRLVFKAPTGSGKTVMASQMLDELTTELEQDGQEVAIIWIAPNKLHQQSYFRMKNYFSETRALSPVMYDELDHSIDGYIKPGEIFFVNWESINKDNNVMVRDTETSSSLYDLTRRTQEDHHLPILCQLHVQFHTVGSHPDGQIKGFQGVFRRVGARAAVCENSLLHGIYSSLFLLRSVYQLEQLSSNS